MKNRYRLCLKPFDDYHSYGPLKKRYRGRLMIALYPNDYSKNKKLTILYSRYLLSVKLGRKIKKGYEVDHIDGDKSNDTISNLREVTPLQNKHNRKFVDTKVHKNRFEDFNKFSNPTKDLFYGSYISYSLATKMYKWSLAKFGKVVLIRIAEKFKVGQYSVRSCLYRYGFIKTNNLSCAEYDEDKILKYAKISLKKFCTHNIQWITTKTHYSGYIIRKVLCKNNINIIKTTTKFKVSDKKLIEGYNKCIKELGYLNIRYISRELNLSWNQIKDRLIKLKIIKPV